MATDRDIVLDAIRGELERQHDLPTWDSIGWLCPIVDQQKIIIDGRLDCAALADAILAALAKRPQMTTTN